MTTGIIEAVCSAFIHSLWQGALLFLIIALLLSITKNEPPAFRYKLMIGGYFLFLILFAYTFFIRLDLFVPPSFYRTTDILPIGQNVNEYYDVVMCIWIIVFIVKMLLMIRSFVSVEKLKRSKSEEWKQHSLLVRIYQSSQVSQPLVIGFIKPVVLVPVGFFNRLAPAEAEAILMHELAHIKRHDYLINIIQIFFDSIFFFNPFIYWLSSRIRREREFCCDQWAAAQMNDNTIIIKALLSFHDTNSSAFTMALVNTNYPLSQRAQRLLQGYHKVSRSGIVLAFLFAIIATLTSIKFVHPLQQQNIYPPGVSKEWIDGYNAARNYLKSKQTDISNKKSIEKELQKKLQSTQ